MTYLIATFTIAAILYISALLLLGGTATLILAAIDVGLLAIAHHHHFTARR